MYTRRMQEARWWSHASASLTSLRLKQTIYTIYTYLILTPPARRISFNAAETVKQAFTRKDGGGSGGGVRVRVRACARGNACNSEWSSRDSSSAIHTIPWSMAVMAVMAVYGESNKSSSYDDSLTSNLQQYTMAQPHIQSTAMYHGAPSILLTLPHPIDSGKKPMH